MENLPKEGIMQFVKWIQRNKWTEHSSGDYWCKGDKWPPEKTVTETELFEMFFGKQL